MSKDDNDLIVLGSYFELKATYSIEQRGINNFKPIMTFSSRKEHIINYISKVLKQYDIKHSITFRESGKDDKVKFYSLRVSYAKNLVKYFELFFKFIKFKSKEYREVERLSFTINSNRNKKVFKDRKR